MSVTIETATKLSADMFKQVGAFCQTHIVGRFTTQFPQVSAKIASVASPVLQQLKRVDPMFVAGVAATLLFGKAVSYIGARWQANSDYQNAETKLKDLRAQIAAFAWDVQKIESFYNGVYVHPIGWVNPQRSKDAKDLHVQMATCAKDYLDLTKDADAALQAIEGLWIELASALPQPQRGIAYKEIEKNLESVKNAQGNVYDKWLPAAENQALAILQQDNNWKHIQNCGSNNTLHNLTTNLLIKTSESITDAASAWKAIEEVEVFLLKRVMNGRPDGVGPTGGLGERWPKEIAVSRLDPPEQLVFPVARLLAEKKTALAKAPQVSKMQLAEECAGLQLILNYAQKPQQANLDKLAAHYDDFDADSRRIITDLRQIGIKNMTRENKEELESVSQTTGYSKLARWLIGMVKNKEANLVSGTGTIVDTSFLKAALLSGKPFQYVFPNVFTTVVKESDWTYLKKLVAQAQKSKETVVNPLSHLQIEANNCSVVPLTQLLRKFGFDPKTRQPTSTALITNLNYADGCYRYAHEWVMTAPKMLIQILVNKRENLLRATFEGIGTQIQQAIREEDKKPHLFSILTAALEIYRSHLFNMADGQEKNLRAYLMLAQEWGIKKFELMYALDCGALQEYNKQNLQAQLDVTQFSIRVDVNTFK